VHRNLRKPQPKAAPFLTRGQPWSARAPVVTFGPIFRFDASSAFAALVAKNPTGAALAALPDVAPLAGGVAIKAGDEIVGGLGVSGSPGGDKDEACAHAGVASIKEDLVSSW
jgi:uncharacterized protein GlcG (DUF336 family)